MTRYFNLHFQSFFHKFKSLYTKVCVLNRVVVIRSKNSLVIAGYLTLTFKSLVLLYKKKVINTKCTSPNPNNKLESHKIITSQKITTNGY